MAEDLTLTLSQNTLKAALEAWQWKIGDPVTVILTTLFGDIFYKNRTGDVLWLSTGAGTIERVAESEDEFHRMLRGEAGELWLLPQLVAQLRTSGKGLGPEQCYTLITPPVFKEGKYEAANIKVISAIEHFRFMADLHRQIENLPDGAKVRFNVTE